MDFKKISLIFILISFMGVPCLLAGQTTISGTASCVMPDLFEFKSPAITSTQKVQTPAPPIPMGASGKYEVQKEEKLIQSEKNIVIKDNAGAENKVTVYTICAK